MKKLIIIVFAILILVGAVFLGLFVADNYNSYYYYLLIGTYVLVGLTIISIIIDYKKKTKLFFYFGYLTIALLVSVMTAKIAKANNFSDNQIIAKEMIRDLDAYKSENNSYPKDIKEATEVFNSKVFSYQLMEDGVSYKLKYSVDGWHYKEYDSRTREWTIIN